MLTCLVIKPASVWPQYLCCQGNIPTNRTYDGKRTRRKCSGGWLSWNWFSNVIAVWSIYVPSTFLSNLTIIWNIVFPYCDSSSNAFLRFMFNGKNMFCVVQKYKYSKIPSEQLYSSTYYCYKVTYQNNSLEKKCKQYLFFLSPKFWYVTSRCRNMSNFVS